MILRYLRVPSVSLLLAFQLCLAQDSSPVVVELFTAEGCSSCPPADRLLAALDKDQPVPEARIIVLGEHVDYWDAEGWPDRFAAHLYTLRQQDYAQALGVENIYTPQMVVNGRVEFNGADGPKAIREIRQAAAAPRCSVSLIRKSSADLSVTAGQFPPGIKNIEIFLAVTEDSLTSDVRRGENFGRRLTHTGVVRSLALVGRVDTRRSTTFNSDLELHLRDDWNRQNLNAVILVADRRNHHIIGAAKLKL